MTDKHNQGGDAYLMSGKDPSSTIVACASMRKLKSLKAQTHGLTDARYTACPLAIIPENPFCIKFP